MVLMVANSSVPKELFVVSGSEAGKVVVDELLVVVVAVFGTVVGSGVVEELNSDLVLTFLVRRSLSRNLTAILLSQEQ